MKRRKNDLYYLLVLGVLFLGRVLPRKTGLRVFSFIGLITFWISITEKQRTLKHLREIYGTSWDEQKIRKTARDVFIGLAKNAYDAMYLRNLSEEKFDEVVSWPELDILKKSFNKGKGVVVIAAHIGCFEMLLNFFPRKGFPILAVAQRLFDKRIDSIISRSRKGYNMDYISRKESARGIIRHIKQGKLFGVLIDQDTDVEGVFAPFLGRQAFTPCGPVKIAMRYEVPVFVVTTARQPDDTHKIFLHGPLKLAEGNGYQEDMIRNVEQINNLICETIYEYPSQWVWMHRRWKTKQKA